MRIEILDSTLRDGVQGEGISFSVEDKLQITEELDQLGISYIEAGNPGSNPKDLEFFRRASFLSLKHAKLVAFGSTRRKEIAVEKDANVQALLASGTDTVCIFGKCWSLHVDEILHTTKQENLSMIRDTVSFLSGHGKRVFFDGEHFFDGYKENPAYALDALRAAAEAGAAALILCDTNGGCFPDEISEITKTVCLQFPYKQIGIHTHNDGGMAVANAVAGAMAGAVHVQGTYLGYGERCGNANLSAVIANLQIKKGMSCIPDDCLSKMTRTARSIAEISNITMARSMPYVGSSAFAHKAGMHADGVLKLPRSFEHVDPKLVGNERRFLMSEIAGRKAVVEKIQKIRPTLTKDSPETRAVVEALKQMEAQGYQFEGAESSFELLVRKKTGDYHPFFELINYQIISGRPAEPNCSATATIKIRVGEHTQLMAAEGNGPVNALDKALRAALEVFYPQLRNVRLIDYKVRVLDSKDATAAMVRVLITSADGSNIWTTVGVSGDVLEASWTALVDSIEYALLHGQGCSVPQ